MQFFLIVISTKVQNYEYNFYSFIGVETIKLAFKSTDNSLKH